MSNLEFVNHSCVILSKNNTIAYGHLDYEDENGFMKDINLVTEAQTELLLRLYGARQVDDLGVGRQLLMVLPLQESQQVATFHRPPAVPAEDQNASLPGHLDGRYVQGVQTVTRVPSFFRLVIFCCH